MTGRPAPEEESLDPKGLSRRTLLKTALALPLVHAPSAVPRATNTTVAARPRRRQAIHVAVVGAGAFGGWTALHLLRRGARVTLLDARGPANALSSSGGETRVFRATYGPDRAYVRMAARSLVLWRENEARWQRSLFRQTGLLWMVGEDDEYERASLRFLEAEGIAIRELSPGQASKRYPQINFDGVRWVLYEEGAGYLRARRACQAVFEGFVAEGGEYRPVTVEPGEIEGREFKGLVLSDGSQLTADSYLFACGPWLPKLFGEVLGNLIQPTRQEVFFFGTPNGDVRFTEEQLPVWADHADRFFYGIPGNDLHAFKVADDTRGPVLDPSDDDRVPRTEILRLVRERLAFRFPGLAGAPLVDERVCQYSNTPDQHFIIDRHPRAANLWLAGGGSGHGFKHGPALGELVAESILGLRATEPLFSLSRFSR